MAPASVFDQILDYGSRADPYPLYSELRHTPVSRSDDGTFVVSTYAEIAGLLHDPRLSSDRRNRADPAMVDGPGLPPAFIGLDPPAHDRIRRLLTRHFGPPHSPGRVAGLVPAMAEIAGSLADDLAGRDRVDLVDDFAYPLPVTVICRLLGVPPEDEPRFRVWADVSVAATDPATGDLATRLNRRAGAMVELGGYLGALADAGRRQPRDDLLSGLATDDGPDGRLTREEIMANAALLLIAGHETTVNLIANGMLTLLRHPEILARLRREPDLATRLVEELLRYEPPVQYLPNRTALDDLEIAGTTIPRGAAVALVLAAGNRDPGHVHDPDRFDPDRPNLEHLGFGGGVHYCFGAPLARLEAQLALTELARRLVNPRLLADPPPYRPSPVLRGPRHLPVMIDDVTRGPARPRQLVSTGPTRRQAP
ncbi:cytochrome P450 [Pseudofrankia inefficax]|uniref:Cytochrome P450 n=1 Tax=Pseudofrankia inefficax (strain DSM 45817 / CECT 9037 / DDB 130130 / EuI1c) TaxID=298654 RepID=E3J4F3_PSEI1|nr:cytochrome P450 [Pseudofrankia inefficax]ADP83072.1 cytochrome P450 [Pseudofrankia inefficax]